MKVFTVRKNQKGKFALTEDGFALIERKYLSEVLVGEVWRGEIIREITDKRGRKVLILKPIQRVYRLKNEKVYCGLIEVGSPEIEEKRETKPIFALNDYGLSVDFYKIYKFNGEILEERYETGKVYWASEFDRIEEEEIRETLKKIKPQWLKWLKRTLEEEKPFGGNRQKQIEEIERVVRRVIENHTEEIGKLEEKLRKEEKELKEYLQEVEATEKWLREKGIKEVRHLGKEDSEREVVEVIYEDGREERAEAYFWVERVKEYDDEWREWDFYVRKSLVRKDDNWDRLEEFASQYNRLRLYQEEIERKREEIEKLKRNLEEKKAELEKMKRANLKIKKAIEGYTYGVWEYDGRKIYPLEREIYEFSALPLVYQAVEYDDFKTLQKVKSALNELQGTEKEQEFSRKPRKRLKR